MRKSLKEMHGALGRRKWALAVDDEEGVRRSVSVLLAREGYGVTQAKNGREAADLLEKETFDLVVTDLDMPEMSGMELCRWMNDRRISIPAIIVSGRSPEMSEEFSELPSSVLIKPFSTNEFVSAVRRAEFRSDANV